MAVGVARAIVSRSEMRTLPAYHIGLNLTAVERTTGPISTNSRIVTPLGEGILAMPRDRSQGAVVVLPGHVTPAQTELPFKYVSTPMNGVQSAQLLRLVPGSASRLEDTTKLFFRVKAVEDGPVTLSPEDHMRMMNVVVEDAAEMLMAGDSGTCGFHIPSHLIKCRATNCSSLPPLEGRRVVMLETDSHDFILTYASIAQSLSQYLLGSNGGSEPAIIGHDLVVLTVFLNYAVNIFTVNGIPKTDIRAILMNAKMIYNHLDLDGSVPLCAITGIITAANIKTEGGRFVGAIAGVNGKRYFVYDRDLEELRGHEKFATALNFDDRIGVVLHSATGDVALWVIPYKL